MSGGQDGKFEYVNVRSAQTLTRESRINHSVEPNFGWISKLHYEPAAVLQALRPSAGPASARYRRNRKVRFRAESQLSGHGVLGQDGLTWFAKLDDKAWRKVRARRGQRNRVVRNAVRAASNSSGFSMCET